MANTYITKSFSTTGNRQKFTLSMWIKRGIVPVGNQSGTERMLFQAFQNSSNQDQIWLQSNGTINYVRNDANAVTPSQVLRDPSAWYHLVFAGDTTQGSNANRLKVYVNGTLAPIGQGDTIAQNSNFGAINNAQSYTFGKRNSNDWYFDGSMSHIHMVDGTAYPASTFGSVDSVTGEWKINTSPSVTYGNNGFFILKDGNSVTDQSGKNNNFSVGGGALTTTKDCPSNVLATVNPLWFNSSTFSNGNNTVAGGSAHRPNIPTLAASSGKYYFEAKIISGNSTRWWMGYADQEYLDSKQNLTSNIDLGGGNISGGTNQKNGAVTAGWGNALQQSPVSTIQNFFSSAGGANDIMAMAIDLDNQKIWWSQNGTWRNGSASASTTFNASYPDSTNLDAGRSYYLCTGSENSKWSINYGNGFFGTTAITTNSGNGYAGAEGASKFNYAVPSGFSALSTKGLNQ